jgi:hypothetical protein
VFFHHFLLVALSFTQENLGTHLKYVLFSTSFTLLKLRSLKLRTLGSVCTHCTRQTYIPQRVYKQNAIASLLLTFCATRILSEYLWFETSHPHRVPLILKTLFSDIYCYKTL